MSVRRDSSADDAQAALAEHAARADRNGARLLLGRDMDGICAAVAYTLETLRGINTKAMRPEQRRRILNACDAMDRANATLARAVGSAPPALPPQG